jgi:hypothetical protein
VAARCVCETGGAGVHVSESLAGCWRTRCGMNQRRVLSAADLAEPGAIVYWHTHLCWDVLLVQAVVVGEVDNESHLAPCCCLCC